MNSTRTKVQSHDTRFWCPCYDADSNRTHRSRERRQFRCDLARGLYD